MNSIKTLALGAALFASQSAIAANYNFGLMGPPANAVITVNTSSLSLISDTFTFSLASSADVSGKTSENGKYQFGFILSGADVKSVTLYNNASNTLMKVYEGLTNLDLTPASFTFEDLAAGSYSILVNGISGFGKGSYSVTLATTSVTTVASAVPEPESFAMMLVGLGLIGFTARRKLAK